MMIDVQLYMYTCNYHTPSHPSTANEMWYSTEMHPEHWVTLIPPLPHELFAD